MSDPIFSPDGKWMWTGSEWIPAPPSSASSADSIINLQDSVMSGDVNIEQNSNDASSTISLKDSAVSGGINITYNSAEVISTVVLNAIQGMNQTAKTMHKDCELFMKASQLIFFATMRLQLGDEQAAIKDCNAAVEISKKLDPKWREWTAIDLRRRGLGVHSAQHDTLLRLSRLASQQHEANLEEGYLDTIRREAEKHGVLYKVEKGNSDFENKPKKNDGHARSTRAIEPWKLIESATKALGMNRVNQSKVYFRNALKFFKEQNDHLGIKTVCNAMAVIELNQGNPMDAESWAGKWGYQCVKAGDGLGYSQYRAWCISNLN